MIVGGGKVNWVPLQLHGGKRIRDGRLGLLRFFSDDRRCVACGSICLLFPLSRGRAENDFCPRCERERLEVRA